MSSDPTPIMFPRVDNAPTIDTRARTAVMTIGIDANDTRPRHVAREDIQLAESELGAYLSAHDEPHPEE